MRRNYEEENRNVKVTVWWDFENCQVPSGVNVERVANRIASAIRSAGIKGPVTITAFGDVMQLSRASQEGLTSTGVCLNHVPNGGRNSSDRLFMADLVYWVAQNPPPAHFFLITSDKDFANILHRLRMSNYNVLLASNSNQLSGVLCSAATIMWPWAELIKGENITPRHYNHPPDGFYGSWYGQYKGVLDDPFQNSIQHVKSEPEESTHLKPEVKIRPISRVVLNGIRNVLHSYPEGLSLSELREELKRKNIILDKDYYGYKKFSKFIASLSNIVQLIPNTSMVVDKRLTESVNPSSKPSNTQTCEIKMKSKKEPQTNVSEENSTLVLATPVIKSEEIISKDVPTEVHIAVDNVNHSPKPSETETINSNLKPKKDPQSNVGNVIAEELLTNVELDKLGKKEGLFKRIWTTLTSSRSDKPDTVSINDTTSSEGALKTNAISTTTTEEDAVKLKKHSLNSSESVGKEKNTAQPERLNEVSDSKMGLFSNLAKWWQLIVYGNNSHEEISVGIHPEADARKKHVKITHELFSRSDFWDDIESFLLTSSGANLIFMSISRDQLIQNLQRKGPSVIKDLNHTDMLKLVDLLISEKKWIEESASQTFPFKVTTKKETEPSDYAHKSIGLSSLFTAKTSNGTQETTPPQNFAEFKTWYKNLFVGTKDIKPERLHNAFEANFNKKLNCFTYGYPTIRSLIFACSVDNESQEIKKNNKASNKGEILNDCHKLVIELLKDSPSGFNMGNFRPAFFKKYGYVLDCQTIGYSNLTSLLQIMPGVKIESSYIVPEDLGNSEDFDELGPVSLGSDECHSTSNKKREMNYSRASLSEEEFSDSGDEVSPSDYSGLENKVKKSEEDSSLMQILDSWYSSKESNADRNDDINEPVKIVTPRINLQGGAENSKLSSKLNKRYSFVAESSDCEKDKLVDNILGGLKKAGESKMQY